MSRTEASVQVKLLRVLQERSYLPLGSTEPRSSDVRIVAATNKDLRGEVSAGRFREDLFYRLHVVPVIMPALRNRREDIPLLAELFLSRSAAQHGVATPHLAHEALSILMAHDWPGNVRELANVVQGASLFTTDGVLRPAHVRAVLPPRDSDDSPHPLAANLPVPGLGSGILESAQLPPMREAREAFDRAYLQEMLRRAGGNVSAAAKMSGRNRTDFYDLLRRYEIDANNFREDPLHAESSAPGAMLAANFGWFREPQRRCDRPPPGRPIHAPAVRDQRDEGESTSSPVDACTKNTHPPREVTDS